MKKGAIFDMDGVLFDTEKVYWNSWFVTADEFGLERKPELPAAMSGTSVQVMPEILRRFYPDVDVQKYVDRVVARSKEEFAKGIEVKAGVVEILEYFQAQKVLTAVASSSEISVIKSHLKRTGIEKFFSAVVSGENVPNSKPAPDIFLQAAEDINIAPTDCYVFEDSFNGVRAGNAAGCTTIMVIDRVHPTEEVKKLCAGIYENLNDALAEIKRGAI